MRRSRNGGRQLDGLRLKAESAEAALARTAKARNDLVHDIDSRRDLNAQLVGELQAANQKLQVTLRDLASASADAATLPIRPFRGDLDWPVASSGGSPLGRALPVRPLQLGSKSTRRKGRPSPPSMTASSHTPMPSAASATS